MGKIKIHIRNNHWKEGFLPCDEEGEKNNTITQEEFEKGLSQYPEIKDKIEYLIDWDDDNFKSSRTLIIDFADPPAPKMRIDISSKSILLLDKSFKKPKPSVLKD